MNMRRIRLLQAIVSVVGAALVVVGLIRSAELLTDQQQQQQVPEVWRTEDRNGVVQGNHSITEAPVIQTSRYNQDDIIRSLTHSNHHHKQQQEHPRPLLVMDILAIGSKHRPDYLQAQQETVGRHVSVRHFIGLTEDDDISEPECDAHLTRDDAHAIQSYCRTNTTKNSSSIIPVVGAPGSLLQRLRRGYADWDHFLTKLTNPAGWLCAQRRASDGLHVLLQRYRRSNNWTDGLPDYVVIMDDDTYVNIGAITDYLSVVYKNSSDPTVMVGCMIRFTRIPEFFAMPWGGWGSILSRGAIQNLLRPIHCNTTTATKKETNRSYNEDRFVQNACARLQANLFNERRYFQQGHTVADLIHAYVSTHTFRDHRKWSNETGSFCVHSDWLWGYFFNYYQIGAHTGNPFHAEIPEARMTSYRLSESSVASTSTDNNKRRHMAMEGQCRFEKEKCTSEAHICHYVRPEQMRNLTAMHETKRRNDYISVQTMRTTLLSTDNTTSWNSLWNKKQLESLRVTSRSADNVIGTVSDKIVPHKTTFPASGEEEMIPVFVYPFANFSIEHELKHFVWDGVQQSQRLALTNNATAAPIWIVDALRAGLSSPKFCTRFVEIVQRAQAAKDKASLLPEWKVVLLHWNDQAMDDFLICFRAIRIIDSTRVYRFKRSMVTGRHWNDTRSFVEPGHVLHHGNWREHSGAAVRQINYGVRTDVVNGLQRLLDLDRDMAQTGGFGEASIEYMVKHKERTTDVSHFWPLKGQGDKSITRGKGSKLRDAVSNVLQEAFSQQDNDSESRARIVFVGLAGQAKDSGRNEAQQAYLARLLDSKIVVVAQKDLWEDHYRLMEALVSGAMVMTDPMLMLPKGLENGTSIVLYSSLEDLVSKAKYYLDASEERQRIALEGYKVAMSMHRSWQMMESIVFGSLL